MILKDSVRRILGFVARKGEEIDAAAVIRQHNESLGTIEVMNDKIRDMEHQILNLKQDNGALARELERVAVAIDRDVPSITKQTPWKCGIYDFSAAKKWGYRFFNLGIVTRLDGDWLITRRSRPMEGTVDGMNDLVAFRVNEDKKIMVSQQIKFPKRYKDEHFEDPRAIYVDDRVFISASTFHRVGKTTWVMVHQILSQMTHDWTATGVIDPVYGGNGGSPMMQTGNEKNWLWFHHNGRFHMVYSNQPHDVVEFDERWKPVKSHKTRFGNPLWKHGEIRGGTPPVRVGDEYFSFFHSSLPWIGRKRRYHMGAYAFEAHPPFRITRMSTMPILSGSKDDPWHDGLPLVVFPCGAILRNGTWTVTMGINDCESGWIEIPHNELTLTLRDTVEIENEEPVEVVNPTVREESKDSEADRAVVAPPTPVRDSGKGKPEVVALGDEDSFVTNL